MNIGALDFKKFFPEFRATSDEMIELYLTEATKTVDEEIFGAAYEQAVFYRAAHMLALSPSGMSAKLVNEKAGADTTYALHFKRIARGVSAAGYRVT